ncbi:DUF488 domain-containing protein [Beijerinckia indica]|uniref:Uroporphyrin-III C-methyltransferase n=1 Tax=Beijerinckia indica subsp. indica (strain ATCC 9039 / DSM 1715 / NCIMB 8712) TaxID=395963 RepID=B2ID52_BEII9|nr:DUF488 domain-containing protein [Beijerinckia indica]ACB96817.1 protein of unknown function DUF488 [Beijerinckia indica subsp. indica ATCC 9039]
MASRNELQIKRVYEPADDDDGARVLIDRVWPRGVTKQAAALSLWLKEIAPSAALRKWFGHDPTRFQEFQRRYRAELDHNEIAVSHVRDLLKKGRVTLLYGAHDMTHNNAIVLRDYIGEQEHSPLKG